MTTKQKPERSLILGNKLDPHSQAFLLVETAKACYVMSRPILNSSMLWYMPASIHVMHHSLESFIKAFLLKEDIFFPHRQKGHQLVYLLEIGQNKSNMLDFFADILNDLTTKDLLLSLDNSYLENKYWETGFSLKCPIVDIFDQLIYLFTEKFHQLYGPKNKEASVDVLEEMADLMEKNRKYPITLCILPKHEK